MQQILPDGSQITLIHFTYLVSGLGNGYRIACMPNMSNLNSRDALHRCYQRSDDPRAVNCTNCKKSEAFISRKNELARNGIQI